MLPPYSPRQGTAGISQTLHLLSNSSSTGEGLRDLLCPLPCPCAQGDLPQEKEVYLLTLLLLASLQYWRNVSICQLPFAHHHCAQALKGLLLYHLVPRFPFALKLLSYTATTLILELMQHPLC